MFACLAHSDSFPKQFKQVVLRTSWLNKSQTKQNKTTSNQTNFPFCSLLTTIHKEMAWSRRCNTRTFSESNRDRYLSKGCQIQQWVEKEDKEFVVLENMQKQSWVLGRVIMVLFVSIILTCGISFYTRQKEISLFNIPRSVLHHTKFQKRHQAHLWYLQSLDMTVRQSTKGL